MTADTGDRSLPTPGYCGRNGEDNPLYRMLCIPAGVVVRGGDARWRATGETPGMMFGLKAVGNMEIDPGEVELDGFVEGRELLLAVGVNGMRCGGRGSAVGPEMEVRPGGIIAVGCWQSVLEEI